jgi:hypothetical protein
MEYALKFVAMGGFLNFLVMTVIQSAEMAARQIARFKIDTNA